MGRSRGGLTTKIHALVDAFGLPIELILSDDQGSMMLADTAYDADGIRAAIAERGAWANIPSRPQRKFKPTFSKHLYKVRNLVERFFSKIKHFRAVATRYDKLPENYLATVKLASIRIWLKFNESMT